MDPFSVLADPRRRRILELIAHGERTSGDITSILREETGISQPAISQHLAVLRDAHIVQVRADAQRRLYSLDPGGLDVIVAWLDAVLPDFRPQLDALATEVARGKRDRHSAAAERGAGREGRTQAG
jgi:DNA-binding transcriptional ArsR family regulator